jgi:hypothetical protein
MYQQANSSAHAPLTRHPVETSVPWLDVGNHQRFTLAKNPLLVYNRGHHTDRWQFFKPGFLVALAVMILTGTALSRFAHNQYFFLLGVAVLDLGIAVALLGSSHVFWREKSLICE